MRVIAYYQRAESHDEAHELALLQRWMVSWQAKGFQPKVVGPMDAQAHPAYHWFAPWATKVPSYNPRAYENACWLRWLSIGPATHPGEVFVFADYDMANLGFSPNRAKQLADPAVPVNLDGAFTCGPFILTHEVAFGLPLLMRTVMEMERVLHPDQGHFGDMMFWRAAQRYHPDLVVFRQECEYWSKTGRPPICHIANPAIGPFKITKMQAWDELEKG